jgi:hypothetical protein
MLSNSGAFRRISASAALVCIMFCQTGAFAAATAGANGHAPSTASSSSAAGGGAIVVTEDAVVGGGKDHYPHLHQVANRAVDGCSRFLLTCIESK